MSFPRYPQYKDSGVEWLGKVPGHWAITKTKHVCSFFTGWTPPTGNASSYEGENLWANISDLGPKFLEDTAKRISNEAIATSGIPCSPKGSLLFSFKLSIGQVSFVGQDMFTNEAIATFLASPQLDVSYAYYAFPLFLIKNASENIYGAKLLNQELIRAARLALPPIDEQRYIANFLDYELAKVDGLTAEQEKLIALLKEKRQAVISHAVTKGLDPSVLLKDSGVEWLGEVPAHWHVMPIRLAAKLESGHTPSRSRPEYWEDCYIPWMTLADVWQIRRGKADYIYETKETVSDLGLANSSARLLPKGTVVLSRTASVGFSAIMGVDMATTQDFANWVCGEKLIPEFLLFVFRSMEGEFRRLMMGSTHNTIYMPDIQAFRFVLPSLEEQEQIIKHCRRLAAEFDELIDEAQHAIDLLKERRSALISAAVTGQIDVRGLIKDEQEQAA